MSNFMRHPLNPDSGSMVAALRRLAVLLLTATAVALSSLASAAFVEGEDYLTLAQPEKINSDKIIVREFFWYGCPHCYHLDPHAQAWKKTMPDDVVFYHTPAALNPLWEASARGFYSVQFLGKSEAAHVALFDAIHKNNKNIFDQNALANFYANYGVDQKKFNDLYNSFAVTTKIGRSRAAAKRYQLTGVPAVVVHGKYVVKGSDARVFEVVDYLIGKIRAEGVVGK